MSLAAAAPLAAQNPPRELIAPYRARTIDGLTFTRESLKGKVVLVQHWATWCGYCRKDEPAVEQVIKEHTKDGLVVLAINSGESRDKVKEYLKDHPRTAHIVLTPDTNLAVLFQDVGVPAYLLIDRDAKLAAGQPGAGGILALRQLLKEAGIEKK
jgi:thiol-disulfide isomerase/thioredoxin